MNLPFHAQWSYAATETVRKAVQGWQFLRLVVGNVTSEERHERRYQRRKQQRTQKRYESHPGYDDFDAVFSFGNLWQSYRNCRKNVGWKGSVQRYKFAAPVRVLQTYNKLKAGKYKCVTPHEWDTWERGKKRHIKSVPIGERVVQRCLADNALIPVLAPSFIYDNGACLKDKGYDFAQRRLQCHLDRFYRQHKTDGYILLFDFSKFYDNVDHNLIRNTLAQRFTDQRILGMVDNIMATFGSVGLGLGSQISQILALASADRLDHFVKQDLRIRYYARYNDDGYLIHESKAYLRECLARMQEVCNQLHIKLNMDKTHIVKLSHGFKFLKARIYPTSTGKTVCKINKKSIVTERRKLKKLKLKLQAGIIDMEHITMQYQAWRSFALKFDAWHTVQSMDALYKQLYIDKEAA